MRRIGRILKEFRSRYGKFVHFEYVGDQPATVDDREPSSVPFRRRTV